MDDSFLRLMPARRGHFRLESGHHGDLWLDVDRLFVNPAALRPLVCDLAARVAAHSSEILCGPLTGGAFLAQMVAEELNLPWVYAARMEPSAKAASHTLFPIAYPIPAELADIVRGRRVAVINDVTNAGSAVRGALASLRAHNATPVVIATLLALGDAPAALAASEGIPLEALAHEPNNLWEPAACPLCAAGSPLVAP
jgi:orotate phosphoribosyltransferase